MDHLRCCSSLLISILSSILVGIVLGAACIVMRRKGAHEGGKKRTPPGPRGLPIIGHLHLLGELPHQALYDLSKVHGPLMSLRLGSVPIVVASSPNMARQILKEHDLAFAGRPPLAIGSHVLGGPKSMIFSSASNPLWKTLRQISASELFSSKQLERFRSLRVAEARALMRSLLADCVAKQTPASPARGLCCPRPKLRQAFNDLISKMMTGQTLIELAGDEAARNIMELVVEVLKLLGTFNVGDYLPYLAWMDLQGYTRRSKKVGAALREAFERVFQSYLQTSGEAMKKDEHFLNVLQQYACNSSSTPILSTMTTFLELLIGGTGTCASTVEWILAELITNPMKMHQAQEEIEQVVGRTRIVDEEDIAQLPYLGACVKETMRLHPVAPLLFPHETNQSCEILDFQIPSNTQAYVNIWAIGRDPLIWESPLEFLPERFLKADPNIEMQGQRFEFLPFGAGRRICPGLRSAIPSVHLILACLLQGFEWSLPQSQHMDMTEEFGAVLCMKTPIVTLITPRLPQDLYI